MHQQWKSNFLSRFVLSIVEDSGHKVANARDWGGSSEIQCYLFLTKSSELEAAHTLHGLKKRPKGQKTRVGFRF